MLNTSEKIKLFGTDEGTNSATCLVAGALSVDLDAGKLRNIRWHGVELIRGIDCPIRDQNWGTCGVTIADEVVQQEASSWTYSRTMMSENGMLEGTFAATGNANGNLSVEISFTALSDFDTARTGFTLLHPIAGLAGGRVTVLHGDGKTEQSVFPETISPSQPVFDMRGLIYSIAGVSAAINFDGEIFEMEDQRNWTDASYKTYCRPLAWPCPYTLKKGEIVRQKIDVSFSGTVDAVSKSKPSTFTLSDCLADSATVPEITLAIEADWLPNGDEQILTQELGASRYVCRAYQVDDLEKIQKSIGAFSGFLDFEFVLSNDASKARAELKDYASICAQLGIVPDHVTALPLDYMKSYQPDGQWPSGLTPQDAVLWLKEEFPGCRIGGGVLTNFTEFNRCPPNPEVCDYVTHSTTAIVHAADDKSVFETLEAQPFVHRSAQLSAPDCDYRLGLASIAMRTNPYGAIPLENPMQKRLEMARADPRQRGLFAAAWMVGLVASTEGGTVRSLSLSMPVGPLGLIYRPAEWPQPLYDKGTDRRLFPSYHVFKALCEFAGERRLSLELPDGFCGVAVRRNNKTQALIANCSPDIKTLPLRVTCVAKVLDTDAFDEATTRSDWLSKNGEGIKDALVFGPYAVAFLDIDATK